MDEAGLYNKALSNLQNKDQQFVIIGAMDGINHDALYPFAIKNTQWKGLLVEPVHSYFEELKENYANRSNLIFENVAIADEIGKKDIFTVERQAIAKGEVPFWCNGISTLSSDNPTLAQEGIKDKVVVQKVQCCRFEDLVKKHNIQTIDILQIDAEGYDYKIFQQIWKMGFRPKVIYIEVIHMSDAEIQSLECVLKTNSYQTEREGDNLTAVRKTPLVHRKNRRVAFYTYPQWAFGAIHSALCKELYPHGIDADILDWNVKYTDEDWKDFLCLYDVFVTVPGSAVAKLVENNIPYEKIIAIAHGRYDLEAGLHFKNKFEAFLKFGGVASSLALFAKQIGIERKCTVLRNGIHFDRFYQRPTQRLTNIGYAGSLKFIGFDQKTDCKRSHLIEKISQATHLPIQVAGKRSYLRMPEFYKDVDCVFVSSDATESCGLPLMEAAAAGRLPVSAQIGIASEFETPTGLILPLEEEGFVASGTQRLLELKDNAPEFQRMCAEAQEFARHNYDWSCVLNKWIEILA